MVSKEDAVNILVKVPYRFGNAVGFDKLTELHNEWIRDMVYGKENETLQAHRG